MFDKIGRTAETMASNVGTSRRWFLARAGRAAMTVAGVVAGLAALPKEGQARGGKCCHYGCYNGSSFTEKGPCHHISGCHGSEFPC
jgi:hypothetical protein